jgi:hypothetical protein
MAAAKSADGIGAALNSFSHFELGRSHFIVSRIPPAVRSFSGVAMIANSHEA